MKKAIKIFCIIVIIVFAITPVLSNIYASVLIKDYYNLIETDTSVKLKTVIFSNIMPLINAIFNILVCVYLIKHSCEGISYVPEIVILSVRVAALPFVGSVYSAVLDLFIKHMGTEAVSYLSIYSNLNSSFSLIQSIAGSLLIMALAFSISEKVHNKKQSLIETTDNGFED